MMGTYMYKYELMLVVRPDFDHENAKKREELIKKLVGDGVTIAEINVLGKKPLAYPIQKQTEGIYILVKLEAENGLVVANLEKQSRLNEEVLRYLLTAL